MIKKMAKALSAAFLIAAVTPGASAGLSWDIVDTVPMNVYLDADGYVNGFSTASYVGVGDFLSYHHNLTDDGLGPLGHLTALPYGELQIDIYDDALFDQCAPSIDVFCDVGGPLPDDGVEKVTLIVGGEQLLDEEQIIDLGTFFTGTVGLQATAQINQTGFLFVSIESIMGDFFVGDSTLSLNVEPKNKVAVPEPGVLALLGAGMLGLGAARRRRG